MHPLFCYNIAASEMTSLIIIVTFYFASETDWEKIIEKPVESKKCESTYIYIIYIYTSIRRKFSKIVSIFSRGIMRFKLNPDKVPMYLYIVVKSDQKLLLLFFFIYYVCFIRTKLAKTSNSFINLHSTYLFVCLFLI